MIEISLTEMFLFAWAGLATASWLSAREDARLGKRLLKLFIENPEAREQLIKSHEELMRKHGERT